jgi:predicted enzyme related to lactoylglutathione lyase
MSRVVHFEVHAEDPERAMRFYRELLGWQFTKWEGPQEYWLIKTGPESAPGIDGGLLRRRGGGPVDGAAVNAYVCTADTTNLDQALAAVGSLGGSIALPKMAVPGIVRLGYAKDTEGNILGLMQVDPTAQ